MMCSRFFARSVSGCHGPKEQQNGLRLDRRSIAMRGGTIPVIGPGNSEGSRLFQKLLNDNYGPQMPPTKKLSDEEISAIKQWIDQGAVWPDSAANEAAPVPIDAGAAQLMGTCCGKVIRRHFANCSGARAQANT